MDKLSIFNKTTDESSTLEYLNAYTFRMNDPQRVHKNSFCLNPLSVIFSRKIQIPFRPKHSVEFLLSAFQIKTNIKEILLFKFLSPVRKM